MLTTALDRAVQKLHDEHHRITAVQTEQEKYLLKYRARINGAFEQCELQADRLADIANGVLPYFSKISAFLLWVVPLGCTELEAGQNERKQLELQMIAENRKTSELRHLSRLCTRLLRDKAEKEGELAEAISQVRHSLDVIDAEHKAEHEPHQAGGQR